MTSSAAPVRLSSSDLAGSLVAGPLLAPLVGRRVRLDLVSTRPGVSDAPVAGVLVEVLPGSLRLRLDDGSTRSFGLGRVVGLSTVDEVETSDPVEAVEADRVEDPAAWTGSPVEAVVSASDLVARRDLRGRAVVAAGLVGFLAGAEAVGPLVRVSVRSVAGRSAGRILVDVLDPSEAVEILAETSGPVEAPAPVEEVAPVEARRLVGSDLLRPEFVGRRVEIGRDGRLPLSGLLVGADLRPVSGAVRVLVETSSGLVRVPVSPLAPVSVVDEVEPVAGLSEVERSWLARRAVDAPAR